MAKHPLQKQLWNTDIKLLGNFFRAKWQICVTRNVLSSSKGVLISFVWKWMFFIIFLSNHLTFVLRSHIRTPNKPRVQCWHFTKKREWRQLPHISSKDPSSATSVRMDVLHVPDIRLMWLFQTPATWCHLCVRHICSLFTLLLVFFPLHNYVESILCVCLVFCVCMVGGWRLVPLFKRDIKQAVQDGLNMINMVIFCLCSS